ncbi:MAG: hypothetical protein FWE03_06615 [Firmicutes bacterium]|nr:hypothetical protein [Bacillota bacterium]
MRKKDYKDKLKELAENAEVPNVLDEIKRADFSAYHTSDTSLIPQISVSKRQVPKKRLFFWASAAMAATAFIFVLVFILIPLFTFDNNLIATVNMRISGISSYTIELNQSSQIINITSDSQDESMVLQNISFRRRNFENVLTELLKSYVEEQGITEEQLINDKITFSISMDSNDTSLRQRLERACKNAMSAAKQHCRNRRKNALNLVAKYQKN